MSEYLAHDDGLCKNGKRFTPLVDGFCPACGFAPDMQSTVIIRDQLPNLGGPRQNDWKKVQVLRVADKMEELAALLEPLFKMESKEFAPGTDWWCTIAGWRHNNLYNIRFARDIAECLDKPREDYKPEWLHRQMLKQRAAAVAKYKKESPCKDGDCLLIWKEL